MRRFIYERGNKEAVFPPALKQPGASAADKQLAEKREAWGEALKLTVTLVDGVPSTTGNALLIAGLGTVGASVLKAPAFELAIQVVGIIAAAVGTVLKLSSMVAARASALFASRAKRKERTLDALKHDLREAMERRDGPLVVIVDEIDGIPGPPFPSRHPCILPINSPRRSSAIAPRRSEASCDFRVSSAGRELLPSLSKM